MHFMQAIYRPSKSSGGLEGQKIALPRGKCPPADPHLFCERKAPPPLPRQLFVSADH